METNPHNVPAGMYCPDCTLQLNKVISTGHMWCPDYIRCQYEAGDGGKEPITKEGAINLKILQSEEVIATKAKALIELKMELAEYRMKMGKAI